MDADEKRILEDDRKFFVAADQDKDGKLSNAEFHAFQNPESFPHMHEALIEVIFNAFRISYAGQYFVENHVVRMHSAKR